MIKDFHIIASTFVTNTKITGYYPVTRASIASMSNTDYIDEVVVCDGQSIDQTLQLHSDIPKVKFITGPYWPVDSWTEQNLLGLENTLLSYANNHENKNVINMIFSADTVWTENFRDELYTYLEELIESKRKNYIPLPFCKTINYQFKTRHYDYLPSFFVVSALKFTEDTRWNEFPSELCVVGTKEPQRMSRFFTHAPLSYDMFMFTRENVRDKLSRYVSGMNPDYLLDPDEFIKNLWLDKVLGLKPEILSLEDHPLEAREIFLSQLTEDHFGYNCLGHLAVELLDDGIVSCTII